MAHDGSESVRSWSGIRTSLRISPDVVPRRAGQPPPVGVRERTGEPGRGTGGGLFLVEFSAAAGVEDMHAAFQHAVLRLAADDAPIRWCGGWLVGGQRCLCLVQSADQALVVLARDTAALTVAPVHAVRPLSARQLHPPSPRTGSRS